MSYSVVTIAESKNGKGGAIVEVPVTGLTRREAKRTARAMERRGAYVVAATFLRDEEAECSSSS